MSDETTELLPCPFCGSEATLSSFYNNWTNEDVVMCCNCEALIPNKFGEAIAAWNTRAELGSGTCGIVKTWSDSDYVDDWRYRCSECGCNIPVNERDPETGDVINAANYCPNCGRKVVDEC